MTTGLIPIKQILREVLEVTEVIPTSKKPATNHAGRVLLSAHDGSKSGRTQDIVACERKANEAQFTPNFAERAEQARHTAMRIKPEELRLLPLSEAAQLWWEHVKKPAVRKPRTAEAYELYLKHLNKGLGSVIVCQLHIGHILEYQRKRHKDEGASVWLVNHETNTLSQIMRYADMWDLIAKYFKPLAQPDWTPPKVLTHEEEERFFRIAAANPQWQIAYWAVSITNNTSAYGTELIHLQRKHIILSQDPPVMHVPDGKVKNEFRARVIPLNDVALKQMERVIARATDLAKKQGFPDLYPEHFIFPYSIARNVFDVTRPATRFFIYGQFRKMREITGFHWLCPRNFRNQIITKLFERGTPDETITSIAGHGSIKMSRYYSRIRVQAKADALRAIAPASVGKKAVEDAS